LPAAAALRTAAVALRCHPADGMDAGSDAMVEGPLPTPPRFFLSEGNVNAGRKFLRKLLRKRRC